MEQPYGLIRFYDAKAKRVHQRDGIEVNPERVPILWNNNNRLPMCQFFTEFSSASPTLQEITVLKVLCNNESIEVDLIDDKGDFTRIICTAGNIRFVAWIYYATSDLSEVLTNGIWSIEVKVNDGSTDQIFYSNKFIIDSLPYVEEYLTIYKSFTTKPNDAIAAEQNTLVKTLVDDGVWAKFDIFFMFAQTVNSDGEALKNWVNPGTFDATLVNAPAFVALEGFTGDGATSYINSNWNPSSDGVNYTLNNAGLACYLRNNISGLMADYGALTISPNIIIQFFPRPSNDLLNSTINASNALIISNIDSRGMYSNNRTASNSHNTYKNKVKIKEDTDVSTNIPNFNLFILGRNLNGSPSLLSTRQQTMLCTGSSLTQSDVSTLTDAFEVYMDSNGKGVIT